MYGVCLYIIIILPEVQQHCTLSQLGGCVHVISLLCISRRISHMINQSIGTLLLGSRHIIIIPTSGPRSLVSGSIVLYSARVMMIYNINNILLSIAPDVMDLWIKPATIKQATTVQ